MKKGHFPVFSGADKRGNGKETIIPVSGKEGIQMLRKILHPHTENYTCAFCAVISIGKDIPVAAYAIKPQPLPGIAVIVTCRRSERDLRVVLQKFQTVFQLSFVPAVKKFQMDDFSGHFGGEIRLAYLISDGKMIPVTGGSVNGSLLEVQNNLQFSTDRYVTSRYDGPYALRLEGISVAGN